MYAVAVEPALVLPCLSCILLKGGSSTVRSIPKEKQFTPAVISNPARLGFLLSAPSCFQLCRDSSRPGLDCFWSRIPPDAQLVLDVQSIKTAKVVAQPSGVSNSNTF
jgi:hypothetical protein